MPARPARGSDRVASVGRPNDHGPEPKPAHHPARLESVLAERARPLAPAASPRALPALGAPGRNVHPAARDPVAPAELLELPVAGRSWVMEWFRSVASIHGRRIAAG